MCRRVITIGLILISIGAGILLAVLFPSCFWVAIIGIALICAGVLIFRCNR